MTGQAHFEIYPQRDKETREKTGDFGWRFRSSNGQITATAGEGYSTRDGANRAVHAHVAAVREGEPHPPILDTDD